ncbi:alpha/beta hydrolase [Parasphingopyxis marina]|uniref:Alpha/beta fold hydrolase n=1 Tax=Parasphingopyxis marina TaxID=2761622 RepID=A0A842HVD9_9SPHN|nr:alpha/beta fold hydrolase [Parasphingopyxis marina]MBC2776875.1 alpha/beta fold hydrolase [Parasphingopyxis marina]
MALPFRPKWRHALPALFGLAIVGGQSGCAHFARDQLYAPGDGPVATPEWTGPAPEAVTAHTEDGLDLAGYYWAPAADNRDIVLVLHGRRDNAGRMAGYVQRLVESGRGVLVASYRGFNENPGSPSEAGLIRDARAFYRLARLRGGPNGRVYVFGHSLGGAVAIQLAAREQLEGLITLATFSDLARAAPGFAEWFIPDEWKSLAALAQVEEPLLLIHGADDDYVEPSHARRLFAAACSGATLSIITGVRHRPNFRLIAPIVTGWIDAVESGQLAGTRLEGNASWETRARCAPR